MPADPALRLKILSKAGFLYFGAIEDKDKQLSGFLEGLVSYHGISKLTIAKMAGVEEKDIDRLLANLPENVEIEVKYKIAVTVMDMFRNLPRNGDFFNHRIYGAQVK